MRRRAVLTGVLVWTLVVAIVSAVTWAVIDAAGQDLLAGGGLVTDAAPAATVTTAVSQPAATRSPRGPRAQRTGQPSTESPSRPAPTGSSPAPRSASPSSSRTTAPGRTRTWQGTPGVVSVRCQGERISLLSASPSNGYRIEVDRGQTEIEVHFKSSVREYQVRARCSDGTPAFRVESDGGEGGDD